MYKQATVGDGSREYLFQNTPEGIAVGLAQDTYRECVRSVVNILKNNGFGQISKSAFQSITDGIKEGLTEEVCDDIQTLEDGDVFQDVKGDRHDSFITQMMIELRSNPDAWKLADTIATPINQLRVPSIQDMGAI